MTSATVIQTKLLISGVAKVMATATSMPTPAQMMPRRAVRGELMLLQAEDEEDGGGDVGDLDEVAHASPPRLRPARGALLLVA